MTTTVIDDRAALLGFAEELADAVRPLVMRHFRSPLAIDFKADDTPVTRADRDAERLIRDRIAVRFPGDGILGEEHGRDGLDRARVWVIDPIDGTKAFVAGLPLFGTLIAVAERGQPSLGLIDMPALGERFLGGKGGDSVFIPRDGDARVMRTRDCRRLADAIFCTVSPEMFARYPKILSDLCSSTRMRRFGGDCYSYGLVAMGFVDLVVERGLEPYDFMALVPVIEGAGGVVTDWSGKPLDISSAGDVVAAATPELHAEAVALLARAGGIAGGSA